MRKILQKTMILSLVAPGVFAAGLQMQEDLSGRSHTLPLLACPPHLASELPDAAGASYGIGLPPVAPELPDAAGASYGVGLPRLTARLPVEAVPYGDSIFAIGPAQGGLPMSEDREPEVRGFSVGRLDLSAAALPQTAAAGAAAFDRAGISPFWQYLAELSLSACVEDPRSAVAPVLPAVDSVPSAAVLEAYLLLAFSQAGSMPRAATHDVGPWNADPTGIAGHYPSCVDLGALWNLAPACSASSTE